MGMRPRASRDRHRSQAVFRQQDDPRPARVLHPALAVDRDRLGPLALLARNLEVHSRPRRSAPFLPRAVTAPFLQALQRIPMSWTSR